MDENTGVQPIAINTTLYNKNYINRYYRSVFWKNPRIMRIYGSLLIFILIIMFFAILQGQADSFVVLIFPLILIGIVFLTTYIKQNIELKRVNAKIEPMIRKYSFYTDKFFVDGSDYTGIFHAELNYCTILKARLTPSVLLLQIPYGRAYMLDISCFSLGGFSDIVALLSSKGIKIKT